MSFGGNSISLANLNLNTENGPKIFGGAGDPEGVEVAEPGSLYFRTSGSVGNTMYIKEAGSGSVSWAPNQDFTGFLRKASASNTATNGWTQISGTYSAPIQQGFTVSGSQLNYVGRETRKFYIEFSTSLDHNNSVSIAQIAISKNNSIVTDSIVGEQINATQGYKGITTSTVFNMSLNDFIKCELRESTDAVATFRVGAINLMAYSLN